MPRSAPRSTCTGTCSRDSMRPPPSTSIGRSPILTRTECGHRHVHSHLRHPQTVQEEPCRSRASTGGRCRTRTCDLFLVREHQCAHLNWGYARFPLNDNGSGASGCRTMSRALATSRGLGADRPKRRAVPHRLLRRIPGRVGVQGGEPGAAGVEGQHQIEGFSTLVAIFPRSCSGSGWLPSGWGVSDRPGPPDIASPF
jgi:hypothetical protein